MIISFSVENFRSIRKKISLDFRASSDKHLEEDFVLEIDKPKLKILKMAMLYGANASGKTNILMALDFLKNLVVNPLLDKNTPINLPAFALDKDKLSSFEIEYYDLGICYRYLLKLDSSKIWEEALSHYPKGYKANIFERKYNPETGRYNYKWTDRSYGKVIREKLQLAIPNQTILSAISSVEDSGPLQKAHNWFRFNLSPLFGPSHQLRNLLLDLYKGDNQKKDFYLPILQQADFQIDDILYEEKIESIRQSPENTQGILQRDIESTVELRKVKIDLTHTNESGTFNLNLLDESMGTQRFFGLTALLEMMTKRNICLSIDELDCSLHIDLVEFFLRLFFKYSKESQLIFSSHNVALLNNRRLNRRDAIWITDRLPDGSTELTSVAAYPVRKEHAIDKLFRKGQIGGKPDIDMV